MIGYEFGSSVFIISQFRVFVQIAAPRYTLRFCFICGSVDLCGQVCTLFLRIAKRGEMAKRKINSRLIP